MSIGSVDSTETGPIIYDLTEANSGQELKFQCPRCSKRYMYYRTLYRHMKHECGGQKHYACDLCSKSYTQKHSLMEHKVNLHSQMSLADA